jgi:hypothetical protein
MHFHAETLEFPGDLQDDPIQVLVKKKSMALWLDAETELVKQL